MAGIQKIKLFLLRGLRHMVCLVLLLFLFWRAESQDSAKINFEWNHEPFSKFVQKLESLTPYHFYYRSKDMDSFYVTAKAENETLPLFLQKVFKDTPFTYVMDESNSIYVIKGHISLLPEDFFDPNKTYIASIANPQVQEEASPNNRKLQTSIENKLFQIGSPTLVPKSKITLAGYIRDGRSGEPIAGASIVVDSLSSGVYSDQYGYYSMTLPSGRHIVRASSFGMKTTSRQVQLNADGKLDIDLAVYVASLKEVVVTATRLSNVTSLNMGKEKLSIQTIKQIPVVFGEADILRAVLALPGVTSVGEANTGLNVRGGAADQNLILLNDATVYNPSHLFGFFSAFNPDIVKSVELYKSAIPEKYGGRLSSVLDVTTKQGNTKKITGALGIGPLTSKLTVEGPVAKERTTFIVSARSSYSNWLLKKIPNKEYSNSRAFFTDADIHIKHDINQKNSLFINGYFSGDAFRLKGDTTYHYGNRNANVKWKHNFNNQLYTTLTAGIDRYNYDVTGKSNPVNAYKLSFGIHQDYLRADFSYVPNLKHLFAFGLNSIYYKVAPGSLNAFGQSSLVKAENLSGEQALETALYAGDEYSITQNFSVHAGIRYSVFNYLGPKEIYQYQAGVPKDQNTITDTSYYTSGKFIKTYSKPEIRLALRYTLSEQASVKMSFNTMTQYIHTISNTNAVSPTDILKLSDPYIQPQQGAQLSLGFYRNFKSNTIETSIEFYYKRIRHYLDYKSGASLLLNHHLETDVIDTRGEAYGAEMLLKKTSGKLTGWLSYTYSRTLLKTDDVLGGEEVNGGKYYPANFDKPHNTNFTGSYKFSHRYSLSLGISYSTGRPITLPLAIFNYAGAQRVYYSERNEYRTPDYFRADFSFVMEGNHKQTKLTHNDWTFGVYNLTGRKNVYSIYFVEENGSIKGYKLSIFGVPIPFVTYTIRF